jgi:mono/diheme cytochrome c family protein
MANTTNLVQRVLLGGFAPATAGNPRPFGMPPFVLQLKDKETAALLTYLRMSWGNRAPPVTELDVAQARNQP